ncbi:MAG: EamA family transporter [Gammaproteobacteria bacterium]
MGNALFYLTTILIWGSTWIAITFQLGVVDPQLSVAYRFLLASLLLVLFVLWRRLSLRFSWREHGYMALQALCLFGFNYWLIYLSTQYLTSGLIAVLFSTVIMMNIVNGALFLGSPVRGHVVIGAVIGLAGIVLVFWPELAAIDLRGDVAGAVVLALGGTYLASLGNIVSARNQRAGLPVVQTNAFGMAYGGVAMLLVALLFGASLRFDASPAYLASLLYLTVFGSIVAFGCYLTLVGRIGADKAAYAMLLFPIVALQLSAWFEDYRWSPESLFGVGLLLTGNAIILIRPRQLRRWVDRLSGRGVAAQESECGG